MLHRLLILLIVVGLVGLAVWDIIRKNPKLFQRGQRRLAGGRDSRPIEVSDRAPEGKVLAFRRPPHEVLGVPPDASSEQIRAAFERLRAEYSPENLEHMSPEIQELARRRTRELHEAYEALRDAGT